MALRVILVSVVAGLGLTLPSGERLASWRDSAQAWANAKFAEWDAQMPVDENAFVFVADSPPLSTTTVAAETPAPVPVPATSPTPSAAPDVVAEPAPSAPERLKVIPVDAVADLTVPTAPMPLVETEVASADACPAVEPAAVADAAFDAAQVDVIASFNRDLAAAETEISKAVPAEPFEPIVVPEGPAMDLASVLNRESEGLTVDAGPVAARGALRLESFEAGDLADDPAYVLIRESEGLGSAARVAERESTGSPLLVQFAGPTPGSQLTRAVRLTREAVFAWANLRHGPAVVTIDR